MSSVRLKYLASLNTDCATTEPRPLVALEHLEGWTGFMAETDLSINEPPGAGVAAVEPGDVLFGKLRPYLAKTWLADRQAYASTELLCLRPVPGVNPRWLAYLMTSRPFVEWAVATSDGTKMPRTSWAKLAEYRTNLPDESSQMAIAEFLGRETARIDALIAAKRRLIDLINERCERVVERTVLPGCSNESRRLPSDVPLEREAPSGWRIVPLGALLERITYGFTNPMPAADEGPYMLTANDIADGRIEFDTARRTSESAFRLLLSDKSRPVAGDVLLTKDGSLGRVAVFGGPPTCINQSVALLRPHRGVIASELLAEVLRASPYRDALLFDAGGTAIKHLYISRVAKLRIALPPTQTEQARLLEEVQAARRRAEDAVHVLTKQANLLAEQRQALITAAVTGGLDVPSAVV